MGSWLGSMLNPSCAAIFLAWFGGVGYLLTRHSGFAFWADFTLAGLVGLSGAGLLTAFLRFIQAHEKPMDPAEYEMIGVLGRVTSTIRPDGVGELVYVRDGARRPAAARSEDGTHIARGEEVIVTRYEKGLAYVRTWEAMTQRTQLTALPEALTKEKEDVS
jgi:membrane protein implicated in regulation of membrane protease activity